MRRGLRRQGCELKADEEMIGNRFNNLRRLEYLSAVPNFTVGFNEVDQELEVPRPRREREGGGRRGHAGQVQHRRGQQPGASSLYTTCTRLWIAG